MKIYIYAPNENWIVDRMMNEFSHRWPENTTNNLNKATLFWKMSAAPWSVDLPTITTIHHVDPIKAPEGFYSEIDSTTDVYHTFADNTKLQLEGRQDITKPIFVLPYWVNFELWYPGDRELSREKLLPGLDKDAFVIGSFQRDTEGHDLISPKLSKGPDRFCDYVEKVSKEKKVHVLLGGWRRQYVIKRLEDASIYYTYFELPPIEEVRGMYLACDLYVVGSRYEGGPQSVLEAAATKTPIVSTDVGIAAKYLSPKCILDIEKDIYFPTEEDVDYAYSTVSDYSLEKDLGYIDFFEKVKEGKF